jgi:hypothetical protein
VRGIEFLVGVRRAEKCSDSYSSLFVLHGVILPVFFVLVALEPAFSNLCHFLHARPHAAAGMASFNGGESVANCSASGMSPLDSASYLLGARCG